MPQILPDCDTTALHMWRRPARQGFEHCPRLYFLQISFPSLSLSVVNGLTPGDCLHSGAPALAGMEAEDAAGLERLRGGRVDSCDWGTAHKATRLSTVVAMMRPRDWVEFRCVSTHTWCSSS
eukprot:3997204-Amphidinium_carterae.2